MNRYCNFCGGGEDEFQFPEFPQFPEFDFNINSASSCADCGTDYPNCYNCNGKGREIEVCFSCNRITKNEKCIICSGEGKDKLSHICNMKLGLIDTFIDNFNQKRDKKCSKCGELLEKCFLCQGTGMDNSMRCSFCHGEGTGMHFCFNLSY